jgi:hypothetical protein
VQVQTTAPIQVPTDMTHPISVVNIAINGPFSNQVYVDSIFLGLTSVTPKFSLAIEEQIGADLNASNITQGQLAGAYIQPGAITTNLIAKAAGGVTGDPGNGVRGDQIRVGVVTGGFNQPTIGGVPVGNIAPGTIVQSDLAAGIAAVPQGTVLMFLPLVVAGIDVLAQNAIANPGQNGCPVGFKFVPLLNGMTPVGIQPNSSVTQMASPGHWFGTSITAASSTVAEISTDPAGAHNHGWSSPNCFGSANCPNHQVVESLYGVGDHQHGIQLPFTTVLWCQKQ